MKIEPDPPIETARKRAYLAREAIYRLRDIDTVYPPAMCQALAEEVSKLVADHEAFVAWQRALQEGGLAEALPPIAASAGPRKRKKKGVIP